jgi:ABC-type transport system involved in cytochrome bd biosynthesis fused ATPase/permease subunit
MATQANSPADDPEWEDRLRYWRRKLGRLRIGVEPIEEQVARYLRVTVALTVIPLIIGLMFVALFAAFHRPDVGAILALILLAPIIVIAWLDHALLRLRASAYLRDLDAHETRLREKTPRGA